MPPYKRHLIALDGDQDKLKENNVRAISVKINYSFFGHPKEKNITLRPTDNFAEKFFDITLPNDLGSVEYTITWIRNDGTTENRKGVDEFGLIFIDELPGS